MTNSAYSGSALVLTLLAVAAMSALALGVAQLVPKDYRQSQALQASLQAEQAALSGVEHALLLLRDAQARHAFLELSKEASQNRGGPFGSGAPFVDGVSCLVNRQSTRCATYDRQLGLPQNQTPVTVANPSPLGLADSSYSLVVWHRKHTVGNPNDPYDGTSTDPNLKQTRNATNTNPILERDEVRRLDMSGVGVGNTIRLHWQPIANGACQTDSARIQLLYTWLKADGTPVVNQNSIDGFSRGILEVGEVGSLQRPQSDAVLLSLRLFVTHTDEAQIRDCFVRYALENTVPTDTSDLGFDVIESTGTSNGVRRKIRVLVNRETGRLLNMYDFNLVCDTCENVPASSP